MRKETRVIEEKREIKITSKFVEKLLVFVDGYLKWKIDEVEN